MESTTITHEQTISHNKDCTANDLSAHKLELLSLICGKSFARK
jgi:hypothetical protein